MRYFASLFFLLAFTSSHAQVAELRSTAIVEVVHRLNPDQNSSIVLIGNAFAIRLQEASYFETLLHKSFPDRQLRVRSLGWSGDEANLRPRPLNYGSLDEHLTREKADIIFAFFGLNEAFKGADSLEAFKRDLEAFLRNLQAQWYNEEASPELILVSPIAYEGIGALLPDAAIHNENLNLYTEGMQQVAHDLSIPFINLYEPTKRLMEDTSDPLTVNGIHLNDRGYRSVSQMMARALDLPISSWIDSSDYYRLRKAIQEKNGQFFYLSRAFNGEYNYGSRKDWPGGSSFATELKMLSGMVSALDSIIWDGSGTSVDMERVERVIRHAEIQYDQDADVDEESTLSSQFTLQDGYEIELFASTARFPIANPVALTFDPRGRLWVASMPSYPHYVPGQPPNDKIVILEDINSDGRADRHTVFADSLYLPLGFEMGEGGVYVTQLPKLIHLRDTDGDGHADSETTVLSGFGTEDSHHGLSAFTWGPDGALYAHEGTFMHSQVETPHGPVRDAYGTTWRYDPRSMKLEAYVSYPYANPWGNVFTRDGTHLIGDVSTGMNYFATPLAVATDYPKKHLQMEDFLTSDVLPKTCGMEVVSSRHFPEIAQGNVLFNTCVAPLGINQHRVGRDSSGMIVGYETEPLLRSQDPTFRPVALQFGPDGALYVVDWYNEVINHGEVAFRDKGRDHTHGRIWRITHKDRNLLESVDLTRLQIHDLLDQLKAYEDRTRYRTRIQLRELSSATVLPALKEWVARLNPGEPDYDHYRLEALWVHQQFGSPDEELLAELLKSEDPAIRAAATRVLFYWRDSINGAQEQLTSMSQDPTPRVRLEAIVALSHDKSQAAVNALLSAAKFPRDYYIDYALKEAFKHLQPVWMEMFKNHKEFLEDEPEQAALLLEPLASKEALTLPGFVPTDNPENISYVRSPLSEENYQALSDVPAVVRFRIGRAEVADSTRIKGIEFLAERAGKEPTEILLEEIARLDAKEEDHGLAELLMLLSGRGSDQLRALEGQLTDLARNASKEMVRAASIAMLNDLRGDISLSRQLVNMSPSHLKAFIKSTRWVKSQPVREAMYPEIIRVLNEDSIPGLSEEDRRDLEVSSIQALASVHSRSADVVEILSRYIKPKGHLTEEAARSLLSIPDFRLAEANLDQLRERIAETIDGIPEEDRASAVFENLVRLSRRVTRDRPEYEQDPSLNTPSAERTVIQLATVPVEMRFDRETITVPTGKPVEIVFVNPDNMVHNLLVLEQESLDEVGALADEMAQSADGYERNFIPESDKVLFSTPLIRSGESYTLTFVAPDEEGDYPFACTFPGHWQTMNGILKVVDSGKSD